MKKETIILLSVIVALSGYLFMRNTDGTHYTLPVIAAVAAGDVNRMEIRKGATPFCLKNEARSGP